MLSHKSSLTCSKPLKTAPKRTSAYATSGFLPVPYQTHSPDTLRLHRMQKRSKHLKTWARSKVSLYSNQILLADIKTNDLYSRQAHCAEMMHLPPWVAILRCARGSALSHEGGTPIKQLCQNTPNNRGQNYTPLCKCKFYNSLKSGP